MKPDQSGHSVRETVLTFIREELSYGFEDGFDPSADLIEKGIIDSMSLLRLVSFLEERYQIEVRDEDLVPENFRSLVAVESFVKRCLGAWAE